MFISQTSQRKRRIFTSSSFMRHNWREMKFITSIRRRFLHSRSFHRQRECLSSSQHSSFHQSSWISSCFKRWDRFKGLDMHQDSRKQLMGSHSLPNNLNNSNNNSWIQTGRETLTCSSTDSRDKGNNQLNSASSFINKAFSNHKSNPSSNHIYLH